MNLQQMTLRVRMTVKDLGLRQIYDPSIVNALNEGKNELVKIIRQAREDFFLTNTSGTIAAVTSVYVAGSITLPSDFVELKDIHITTTGYEGISFEPRDISSKDFKDGLLITPSSDVPWRFMYDITGLSEMLLSPASGVALTYQMGYVASPPDMALPTDSPTTIPAEHHDFIVTWAVCEALRVTADERLPSYLAKLEQQKDLIIDSVGERQVRDAVFVRGFMEEEGW